MNVADTTDVKKIDVLLVEDNQENKEVISYYIKNIANVDSAMDGPSAISKAQAGKYAIILMDINLGVGMNGVEATQRIRKIKGYESTPIVAVTAYAMVGDSEIFLNSGCTHYIAKPFSKREMLDLMGKIVEEYKISA
jgi:CheY-like chemotaxis protein